MSKKPRIKLIDALRGLAISGILLLHHIEHFDFYLKPDYKLEWLLKIDKWVWDNLFMMVSGKAFALFSLLFGISFWIIHENRAERNEKYFLRHFWRMFTLALIGGLHLVFFRGDILIMYALVGLPLLISPHLNNKVLAVISIILLINPINLYNLIAYNVGLELYDFRLPYPKGDFENILSHASFLEVLKMNFTTGFESTLVWSWNVGRFFTISGLFFLGVLFSKTKILITNNLKVWYRILVISVSFIYLFSMIDFVWIKTIASKDVLRLLKPMNDAYSKLSIMFFVLSVIVILWHHNKGKVWIARFADFGRMGLTNYILMSVFGTMVYYGWGLGLYKYCGPSVSFLIGLFFLVAQMYLSTWWIKKYGQGPLERLWRKLTWIKINI